MYKLSIDKKLFEDILSKKVFIIEKENKNYWKKELLEPTLKNNKLSYEIKQFKKLLITNGLGEDKPQIVIECLKVNYSVENDVFEFHLGKILEQKNITITPLDERDVLIKQLLEEREELQNILKEIKDKKLFNS